MITNIILAGVGGQGILSLAYILDHSALQKKYHFKQAETHGMAQRGGAVNTHVRISNRFIISDLIPKGKGDLILSIEPLEVQRYLPFLHSDGVVISNSAPLINIANYPSSTSVMNALLDLPKAVVINAKEVARKLKTPKSQNIAVLGAALPFLPFDRNDFKPVIKKLFLKKEDPITQKNLSVLEIGESVGLFSKILLDNRISSLQTYNLLCMFDPFTINPELAPDYAQVLHQIEKTHKRLKPGTFNLPCNKETLKSIFY